MLRRSPSGSVGFGDGRPPSFSTASDSPVRAASWMRRLALSTRRTSAGTTLPASSRTMSPGTSSRADISCTLPVAAHADHRHGQLLQRRHGLLGAVLLDEAEDARRARRWRGWPTVSMPFPSKAEMTAAAIRISTMVSVNCSRSMASGPWPRRSVSSLSPWVLRRSAASAAARPSAEEEQCLSTFSADCVCQWVAMIVFYKKVALNPLKRVEGRASCRARCLLNPGANHLRAP